MQKISLHFQGEPKAVQSVRFANAGGFVRKYQPKETVDWKNRIRLEALSQLPEGFICTDKACSIEAIFSFSLPKSAKAGDRNAVKEGWMVPKTTRPDLTDNLFKGVIDALTGLIWRDDAQIIKVAGKKVYSSAPYIMIVVEIADL